MQLPKLFLHVVESRSVEFTLNRESSKPPKSKRLCKAKSGKQTTYP